MNKLAYCATLLLLTAACAPVTVAQPAPAPTPSATVPAPQGWTVIPSLPGDPPAPTGTVAPIPSDIPPAGRWTVTPVPSHVPPASDIPVITEPTVELGTADSFAATLVGKPLDVARTEARAAGYTLRVVSTNGTPSPVTMDLRTDRINVEVVNDVVTVAFGG